LYLEARAELFDCDGAVLGAHECVDEAVTRRAEDREVPDAGVPNAI